MKNLRLEGAWTTKVFIWGLNQMAHEQNNITHDEKKNVLVKL